MSLKRFRVGTLMLLVVIAALGTALVVQNNRAARREAELQAQLARTRTELIYETLVNSADLELSQWQFAVVKGGGKAARAGMREGNGREH